MEGSGISLQLATPEFSQMFPLRWENVASRGQVNQELAVRDSTSQLETLLAVEHTHLLIFGD